MPATNVDESRNNGPKATRVFVAYLKELSLESWVEAAKRRAFTPGMTMAEMTLRTVVRHLPDHRDVFATKASVLDALQRFESVEGRRLTRSRHATAHLRSATEHAALAVLVRDLLSGGDFATLYAPFESAIHAALLFGIVE